MQSSRQSMLQELQDSVLRNETLQEELRSCGRPKVSRARSSVPAPPAPDFDQPGTPTACKLSDLGFTADSTANSYDLKKDAMHKGILDSATAFKQCLILYN